MSGDDSDPLVAPASGARRWLFAGAGLASLSLGALGVLLPLLPATPFLLLAAACFAKSSPRLHRWLRRHRWFGPPIRAWETHRALPRRAKPRALALLWVTIPVSIALLGTAWIQALLAVVLVTATVVVARLPVVDETPPRPRDRHRGKAPGDGGVCESAVGESGVGEGGAGQGDAAVTVGRPDP